MHLHRTFPSQSAGFSMVEVLVSIVVLTFGMLGMVGMQAAALHSNREARLQSTAAVMARELAEMIRGNRVVGALPAATNPYIGSFSSPLVATTPAYCLNASATTGCVDPTAVANSELTEWLARVDAELPGARVVTCYDSAPFDASGLPQWGCTAATSAPMVIKIAWTKSSTNKSTTGAAALERASDASSVPLIVLPVTAVNLL